MGKPTVKLRYILILILLALVSAYLASRFVFRDGTPKKVTDTTVRARLLEARQNVGLAGFIGSSSNERYSSLVYDFTVDRPGKSALPWAAAVPLGPAGRYEFTWRLRVNFKTLFSINDTNPKHSNLLVKLTDSTGLPLYKKAPGFSLPAETVSLTPGIYVLKVSSKTPLTSVEMNFGPLKNTDIAAQPAAPPPSMREINLKLGPRSMKDFKRLVSFGKNSTETEIVKMPDARVKGQLYYDNKIIGDARIGLSGRSRVHLNWFPSVDIKVSGGKSLMGIPSFKLYRLDTKNGILEFAIMSVLQDMGFFMPRHELVVLKVNGIKQGVYLLMETTTAALFSNARRLDGDILGVNLDKLFFDYPYGAELDARYFFKARGTGYKRTKTSDFFSVDFADKIDPHSLARYIAFTGVYLAAHGLGVDDLRFYMNPAKGLFAPLPRDITLNFLYPGSFYNILFSHTPWLTGEPAYTVWPDNNLLKSDYTFDRNKELVLNESQMNVSLARTDVHPAIVRFVSATKNLALVNRYFKYFLFNDALWTKIVGRAILASTESLSAGGYHELIAWQNKTLGKDGLVNLTSARSNISYLWDTPTAVKVNKTDFSWNTRTATAPDKALSPALFEPVNLSWNKKRETQEKSLALSVEMQIFNILNAEGVTDIKRSFRPLKKTEKPEIRPQGEKTTFNSGRDKIRQANVHDNVATYIMTRTTAKGTGLVLFLVRNASPGEDDYSIITRGGVIGTRPLINKVFYAAGTKGSGKATMDDILKKRFIKGEPLRLLVFEMPLGDKPVFYRLKVPERAYFMFPPYMYLPSRPSGKLRVRDTEGTPEWAQADSKGLHVRAGSEITINKTVTLNAGLGKGVFIERGVTFRIAPGAGLIIKSDLYVNGTKDDPVRFISLSNEPWEGLFVGRKDRAVKVDLKHVIFDNYGTFPKTTLGALKLNGGLTMLRANITMDNVEIRNAHSEDALNLIDSTADLHNLLVSGSFSDSIDLDFSDARIKRLNIENSGGDGLDVSNSLVLCIDSAFTGTADKGISVGEMSNVFVKNSKFMGNDTGIANKDQSSLNVEGSLFERNNTAISEFIKKPWFGKPRNTQKSNTYRENKKNYTWLGFHTY